MKAMYQNPVWILRRPWNHQRLPQATTGSGRRRWRQRLSAAAGYGRWPAAATAAGGPAMAAAAASRASGCHPRWKPAVAGWPGRAAPAAAAKPAAAAGRRRGRLATSPVIEEVHLQ